MAQASTSLRFPAWAGTSQELEDTINALGTRVLPTGRFSVSIRPLLALERRTTLNELANELPEKRAFQIVIRAEDPQGQTLLVVLGHDLPALAIRRNADSEEEIPGNTVTVMAATSAEALELANQVLDVRSKEGR